MLTNFKPIDRVSSKAMAHRETEAKASNDEYWLADLTDGNVTAMCDNIDQMLPKIQQYVETARRAIELARDPSTQDEALALYKTVRVFIESLQAF